MKLKQNKQSKLVVALPAVILLLVALSATLTFAYFTAQKDDSSADVTFGHLAFKTGESLTVSGNTGKIVPGDSITINGTATLQHNIDAFYRVGVTIALKKDNVNIVTKAESSANKDTEITNEEVLTIKSNVLTALGMALGNDNVNVKGDYAYGFAKANTANDASPNTLTTGTVVFNANNASVSFDAGKYGNKWQDVTITITINIQAIQAKNVGTNITLPSTSGAVTAEILNKIAPATEANTDAMYKIWISTSGVIQQ